MSPDNSTDTLLGPFFTASSPHVLGRCDQHAAIPIKFLADLNNAKTRPDILDVYSNWARTLLRSDHCSIALDTGFGELKLMTLTGARGLEKGAIRSAARRLLAEFSAGNKASLFRMLQTLIIQTPPALRNGVMLPHSSSPSRSTPPRLGPSAPAFLITTRLIPRPRWHCLRHWHCAWRDSLFCLISLAPWEKWR